METGNSGIIDIAGFQLRYIIQGKGTPVFVVGSAIYYQRVFSSHIKEHLCFYFIDHRGFVPPPRENLTEADFELDILIEDIETCRKHLGLEKFILVGHSGHTFMALEYAKKYPSCVIGVVLIASTPDYSHKTHEIAHLFFEQKASPERKKIFEENMQQLPALIAADPDKRFVRFCLAAGPKSWFDYTFDATWMWEGIYTNMQMIDYAWGVIFRDINITLNLEKFNRPILLALGRFDFLTGPTFLWDSVKDHFKDLTVRIFEESAHCPPYEEPAEFDSALLKWVIGIKK